MTSAKYVGWTIEKVNDTEYFMTRDAGVYAINVACDRNGKWTGELMTRQKHASQGDTGYGWEVCRNQFNGAVAKVAAEAERRAKYLETLPSPKRPKIAAKADKFMEHIDEMWQAHLDHVGHVND